MTSVALGLLFVLIGLLAMLGSVLNWRLVTHLGKLLNMLLGDRIARGIYILLGLFLFVLGMGQLFGMNWIGN
ncbi:MAG: hypothetical protein M5U11_13155 [Anaerolineales bacterium]|jgi:hypothetical protein|nr:hypothetical protein [Anaerolineales bacterium]MDX9937778.1 hypothetical protein [Anaerolineales bacterium]GER80000.1 conserved hypothetical protein [Candidatus Denitrolinea symbiosum]